MNNGLSASGASGEVMKCEPEPQRNTAAQRSWMYSLAPELQPKPEGNGVDASYMSLPIDDEPKAVEPGPRRITAVTTTWDDIYRIRDERVFLDEE